MARVIVTEEYLENIGDAIRSVNGEETTYKPSEMAAVIDDFYIEPTGTKNITANGTGIDVKDYASADVNVPNSYTASDEGKVVSNGSLKAQTSKNINANGTVDTTENNSVVVAVPNTYTASDEGKVVDDGALVAQGSQTITENGTYDTTLIDEAVVNVDTGQTEVYVGNFTPNKNASSSKSAGWKFTTKNAIKIVGIRFYARSTSASVFLSDASGNTLRSKENVAVIAEQWNDIRFDTPIKLQAVTQYVVWGSNSDTAMKWLNETINPSLVTYNAAVYTTSYSTFPTTLEGNTTYGVDLIALETDTVTEELIVTSNGRYIPPSGVDGYAPVIVNVSGGGSSHFEEYDFTKLSGTIRGVQYSSSGAMFSGTKNCILMSTPKLNDITIEIDIASMQLSSGSHRRLLMPTSSNGFIYRSNGVWAFYNGSWYESNETNGSFLDGSILSAYIDSSNLWHFYKNGVLFFEPAGSLALSSSSSSYGMITLGSDSNAVNNGIIRSVKFYDGEYV